MYFLPQPSAPVLTQVSWCGKHLRARQLYSGFHIYLQELADLCTRVDLYDACCRLCLSGNVCGSKLICLHTFAHVQVSFYTPVSAHASAFLSLCLIALAHCWNVWEREWHSLFFWEHVRAVTLLFISESLSVNEEGHICARMHCIVECTYSMWREISWFHCSRVYSYKQATFCLPANTLVGISRGLYLYIHTWGAHFKCLWVWWCEW